MQERSGDVPLRMRNCRLLSRKGPRGLLHLHPEPQLCQIPAEGENHVRAEAGAGHCGRRATLLSDIHPGDVLIFTILGETLSLAVAVIYGVTLLKMSPKDENYSKSGILKIVAGAITFLMFLVFGVEEKPLWSILLLIPSAVCELISEYLEYSAHSNVLYTIDYDLSESWKNLRTAFVVLASIMYGNLLLMLAPTGATPIFISFVVLSGLGMLVVEIIKTVKLYKTCSCLTYHSYE